MSPARRPARNRCITVSEKYCLAAWPKAQRHQARAAPYPLHRCFGMAVALIRITDGPFHSSAFWTFQETFEDVRHPPALELPAPLDLCVTVLQAFCFLRVQGKDSSDSQIQRLLILKGLDTPSGQQHPKHTLFQDRRLRYVQRLAFAPTPIFCTTEVTEVKGNSYRLGSPIVRLFFF